MCAIYSYMAIRNDTKFIVIDQQAALPGFARIVTILNKLEL